MKKKNYLDLIDMQIIILIGNNKLTIMELVKEIKMAHKNLLKRLKKLESLNLIYRKGVYKTRKQILYLNKKKNKELNIQKKIIHVALDFWRNELI